MRAMIRLHYCFPDYLEKVVGVSLGPRVSNLLHLDEWDEY